MSLYKSFLLLTVTLAHSKLLQLFSSIKAKAHFFYHISCRNSSDAGMMKAAFKHTSYLLTVDEYRIASKMGYLSPASKINQIFFFSALVLSPYYWISTCIYIATSRFRLHCVLFMETKQAE